MINKYSEIPLYSQLKKIIIDKIESGEYAENSKIPSEEELCKIYDISRPTVRQAISELISNGCLFREKGRGTFVSKKKICIDERDYTGFTDSMLDDSKWAERSIISIEIVKQTEVPALESAFRIPSGQTDSFGKIVFLNGTPEEPLSITTTYIPIAFFPEITEDIKLQKPSHEILRGKYAYLPSKSRSSIEIRYSEDIYAQYLKIPSGTPVLYIKNLLTSKSGQAVEYLETTYRADRCRFIFNSSK